MSNPGFVITKPTVLVTMWHFDINSEHLVSSQQYSAAIVVVGILYPFAWMH